MARIRIYLGRHLCTAPRPQKEADALAAAGHEVSVHGLCFDPALARRDLELVAGQRWIFSPYADVRPPRPSRRLRWYLFRLSHRLARESWRHLRLFGSGTFGYGARALRRHALHQPADLTIFHSETGLLAATALRARGLRVGVDFEDWFSRDLPLTERSRRATPLLARLELEALRRDRYLLAPSRALAHALGQLGGSTPEVIYNSFPGPASSTLLERPEGDRVSLHWFSQTLGPARGLETLAAALPALRFPWSLHLRADDPSDWFQQLLALVPRPLHPHIHLHPTVPAAALPAHLARHDIGLATDGPVSTSRDLTISNKFFQYLQAGLAVVAGDTAGHREALALLPGAGILYPSDDAPALARALQTLGGAPATLASARAAARAAHALHFAHELHAPRIPALAARALAP
jgi:glycosyltransferase involved in cell wall biosynthesis